MRRKLTSKQARSMRLWWHKGYTLSRLATKFGVSITICYYVIAGKTYREPEAQLDR